MIFLLEKENKTLEISDSELFSLFLKKLDSPDKDLDVSIDLVESFFMKLPSSEIKNYSFHQLLHLFFTFGYYYKSFVTKNNVSTKNTPG